MPNIITRGIDHQNRIDRERRQAMRRTEDVRRGLTRAKRAQRGDFRLCRDLDKTLKDYIRFKNLRDRKKIESEYYGKQKEYRNGR